MRGCQPQPSFFHGPVALLEHAADVLDPKLHASSLRWFNRDLLRYLNQALKHGLYAKRETAWLQSDKNTRSWYMYVNVYIYIYTYI